ncbi:MAG: ABC transporter ATP-binding protein, partial [Lachnospiraceae bacterium]|nr:ABC transporter ATP-binding protein [Lachnospiraceae bacterium]
MDEQYAIEVRNVEKSFKAYKDKGTTLKERVIFAKRNAYESRSILKGISFEIERGQAVGLIGKNGCGKSTTLKLLTRILKPNAGNIEVRGRVSSLIELGAGFHPDMSGRENIYINASIFGLKNKEIDERLDDIIRFSELEEFIDNPVRTYSSGMYMRLAFAVAINVDADVLLIDEILAVGDVSFQKKCFERLREIKEQGTTIVIVSHDMGQLYNICDRLIWIENGTIKEDGIPQLVGAHYLDSMEEERIARLADESRVKLTDGGENSILSLADRVHPEARRAGSQEVYFTRVDIYDGEGKPCHIFSTGDKLTLKLKFASRLEHPKVNFNMDFVKDNWQYCYGSCFTRAGDELPVLESTGELIFKIGA